MADPQNPDNPIRRAQKQTRLFSNVEMEEKPIKMMTKDDVNVEHQLRIMRREPRVAENVSGLPRGLHAVASAVAHMKQFSVERGCWKEDEKMVEEQPLVPVSLARPMPIPRCEESRKFVANVDYVADLKFAQNLTNAEIAERLEIRPRSIPRLINIYLYESEDKRNKSLKRMHQAMRQHQIRVGFVREALEQLTGQVKTLKLITDRIRLNHEHAPPISRNVLAHILKEDLQYTFRKPQLRMVQTMREDVRENRHVFQCFFKALIETRKARFVWIDETSFNTRSVKYESWVGPEDRFVLTHQTEQPSTAICALCDDGVVYSLVKFGTNTDLEFLSFLMKLKHELRERYKEQYTELLSQLVFVMDNCAIHLTARIHTFFEKSGIVCITLPQYTPEFNPIEVFFRSVKNKVSYSNTHTQ